uniref:Uncharacterized protein n=1 Tax=Arundo donax TaxID=35708 RepID=A0A0A9FVL9_ARUDO
MCAMGSYGTGARKCSLKQPGWRLNLLVMNP